MRVINIATTVNGVVQTIDSFGIFEEQLSDEVVEQAENKFIEVAKEIGFVGDEDDANEYLDDGYFEHGDKNVSIIWSDV